MDKRKLGIAAGGASMVATALAMNVGTAAADEVRTTDCFDSPQAITRINLVMDKARDGSPAFATLEQVVQKIEIIFVVRPD